MEKEKELLLEIYATEKTEKVKKYKLKYRKKISLVKFIQIANFLK